MKKKISILLVAVMLLTLPGFSVAADPAEPAVQTAVEENTDAEKPKEEYKEETKDDKQKEPSAEETSGEQSKEEGTTKEETSAPDDKTSEDDKTSGEEQISEEEIIEVLPEAVAAAEVIAATAEEDYKEAKQNQEKLQAALEPYKGKALFYDDVGADHWYTPGAGYTFSKGIITGMGDNIFAATLNICKAQFITILYRMDGAPNTPYQSYFVDVPDGQFYSSAVTWGVNHNIIDKGQAFGPADDLPRAGMVEMMYRFAKYKGLEGTDLTIDLAYQYADAADVPEYASQAFQWSVRRGIISGTDATHLSPLVTCNRAEVATIIARYCESYFPGKLPDVTFNAGVSGISVTGTSFLHGVFKVQANGVWATHKIKEVKAQVWLKDYSDLKWVTLNDQGNGTYSVDCWMQYWGSQKGTYKAQIFVYLENGLRFCVGSSWGYADIMRGEVRDMCLNIYNQVGWDLYACYRWVVDNISYSSEDPYGWGWAIPSHFTQAEWYSLSAYQTRVGMCHCYAALFYELAKGLGQPVQLITGFVPATSGGITEHGWTRINGLIYDPEFEDETGKNGYAIVYGTSGTWVYSGDQIIEQ